MTMRHRITSFRYVEATTNMIHRESLHKT